MCGGKFLLSGFFVLLGFLPYTCIAFIIIVFNVNAEG